MRTLDDEIHATFVPMRAVDGVSGTITCPEVRPLGELKKGFTPFLSGDVLFAKITPCMENGKLAVARSLTNDLGFGSTEFHIIRPGPSVLSEWLWYFMRQSSIRDEARRHFRGSAGQQRVPSDFLRQLKIPVPPIEEQLRILRRIDNYVESIDEIRSLNEQATLETSGLLSSSLAHTFAELKSTYSNAAIGTCLADSRYGTSRRCDASTDGVPVLRIPNVARGEISLSNLKYCNFNDSELSRLQLKTGDILVVRTNGSRDLVGRCAVYTESSRPFAFASYLIRLRVDPLVLDPHFLALFLTSTMGRDAISRIRRTSAGQYNVNSENLRRIVLPLPPPSIQRKVTEKLIEQRNVISAIAARHVARSNDTDMLVNAVLSKAFAGEL